MVAVTTNTKAGHARAAVKQANPVRDTILNVPAAAPNDRGKRGTLSTSGDAGVTVAIHSAAEASSSSAGIVVTSKGRPFVPKGGNDRLFTPPELARDIVAHFMPSGKMLEPCRGQGAFADAMPGCDWCEISEGRDFLSFQGHGYDWILTNPPWSRLRQFLQKSMTIANNVVFLCIVQHIYLTARLRDIENAGFGIVEICSVPFPPPPWQKGGFPLVAVWIRRGWQGRSPASTRLRSNLWAPDGSGRMVVPSSNSETAKGAAAEHRLAQGDHALELCPTPSSDAPKTPTPL